MPNVTQLGSGRTRLEFQADSRVPALSQHLPHTYTAHLLPPPAPPIPQLSAGKVQASIPETQRQVQSDTVPYSDEQSQTSRSDTKHALRPHCHIISHSLDTRRTDPPTPLDCIWCFTLPPVRFRSEAPLTSYPPARTPGAASNNKRKKQRGGSGGRRAQEMVQGPAASRQPRALTPAARV